MTNRFTEEVCQRLGNYVYRLIDPRNGETFYVGKGRNNRVFDHADGIANDAEENDTFIDSKLNRIRAIKSAGLAVLHVIHRHEIPDAAVFEVEAALIDAYPGLTNIQGGHASSDRGPMNHIEILDKYSLPAFPEEPQHKLILINVNKLEDRFDRRAIYQRVRYCWRISRSRAEDAQYVLAVVRGVVVGAFEAESWMPATTDNFPDIPYVKGLDEVRLGFVGRDAPSDIWDLYVGTRGKRITSTELKHVQYPIRYWKC